MANFSQGWAAAEPEDVRGEPAAIHDPQGNDHHRNRSVHGGLPTPDQWREGTVSTDYGRGISIDIPFRTRRRRRSWWRLRWSDWASIRTENWQRRDWSQTTRIRPRTIRPPRHSEIPIRLSPKQDSSQGHIMFVSRTPLLLTPVPVIVTVAKNMILIWPPHWRREYLNE